MNTAKILGALPQTPAAVAPAAVPSRPQPQPQAVPATGPREGTSEQLLREQARQQAEAAERRAAERARRESARVEARAPYMQREVGLVDRSFDVFVDLVTPTESYRVRIFGPQEFYGQAPPLPAAVGPATAQAAYEAAGDEPRRAAVKTDV